MVASLADDGAHRFVSLFQLASRLADSFGELSSSSFVQMSSLKSDRLVGVLVKLV